MTAIADVTTLLLDAAQSGASNSNIKAVQLGQVTNVTLSASGIASWDNLTNESNFEVQLYKDDIAQGTVVTKTANTLSHDFLSAMKNGGAGVYTVKVTAKGNGTTYSDGVQSLPSGGQTIIQLATVSAAGLTWTGNVAHWTEVASAVSYDVQLYKNGNSINSPVNVMAGSAASGVDFTSAIATAGIGTYTYKVTAKGDANLILSAIQSVVSNDNIKTVSIDANLSGLSVSSGSFNEGFAAGTTAYTANVGNGISSITVTPAVSESHATVTVNGIGVASGNTSSAITLNVGANAIVVAVKAQDGTTIKTYTITVTRAAAVIPPTPTPTPAPTPTPEQTTVKGDVIDQNGTSVKGVEAKVSTETNGNKIVEVKSREAVLLKQPDGTNSTLSDISKLSFSTPVTTNNGSTSANTASVTLKADGTIQVNNLPKGTETKFDVTLDLGNGQKIVIGCIDVKVSSNGDVSLTSTLIDPYGTITDKTTGKIITGANVKLYYANTARNIAAGKTPDTLVPLPLINGFKPNDNKNPQISDASGAYGFMVFPNSDYYIVATKAGYEDFKSPTISVEKEIVK